MKRDATLFRPVSANAIDMLQPTGGQSILDVGCGLGTDAIEFAKRGAKVVGLDASKALIQKCWSHVALLDAKQKQDIVFQHGHEEDIVSMYGDAAFDGVHVSRLLEHVPDPRLTLKRLSKVIKRDGSIVVVEPDWGSMLIDHPNKSLSQKIVQLFSNSVNHPFIGRELRRMMREIGYVHLTMRAVPVVFVNPMKSGLIDAIRSFVTQGLLVDTREKEVNDYISVLNQMKKEGGFTSSMTLFVVKGHRPRVGKMMELPRLKQEQKLEAANDKEEEMNHYEQESEIVQSRLRKMKEAENVPVLAPSPVAAAIMLPAAASTASSEPPPAMQLVAPPSVVQPPTPPPVAPAPAPAAPPVSPQTQAAGQAAIHHSTMKIDDQQELRLFDDESSSNRKMNHYKEGVVQLPS